MAFDVDQQITKSMEEWIAIQEEKMSLAFKACGLTYKKKSDTELADTILAYKEAARMFYYLGKEHGAHTVQEAVAA